MTKHVLGTIRSEPEADDPTRMHHHLDLAIELTQDEVAALNVAQRTLSEFLQDSQLFMMVAWNFNELSELISSYLRAYIEKRMEVFTAAPISLNVNRAFLNMLASMRSYLDFMDRHIKVKFGRHSEASQRFSATCSQEYDSNLSYRLLYKLRNYAQHRGFPIGRISWGQRPSRTDPAKREVFLDVYIVRDDILADFDWGPMAKEVRQLPELIDVGPHAIGLMQSLSNIHLHCIRELFNTLEDSACQLVEFGERLSGREGQPAVFEIEEDAPPFRTLSHSILNTELAKRIAGGQLEDVIRHPEQHAG